MMVTTAIRSTPNLCVEKWSQLGLGLTAWSLSLFHLPCTPQSPHRPKLSWPVYPTPPLTNSPPHFQGLDGAKGEKGASGERGPHGLPVSVMNFVYPRGVASYAHHAC